MTDTRHHPNECGAFGPDGEFVCTEAKGHDGDHVAKTDDGYECDRFPIVNRLATP